MDVMFLEGSTDADSGQHPLHMLSKAEVLRWLKPRLKQSYILNPFIFTVDQWCRDRDRILSEITRTFPQGLLVVRSSALDEDIFISSNAGRYESILNVPSIDKDFLKKSIESIIAGYDNNKNHQILVQSQLSDVKLAGVISSCTVANGKPYYTLSYEESGNTNRVTGGKGGEKTLYVRHGYTQRLDCCVRRVVDATVEVESLMDGVPIQIEFAMTRKNRVVIFQVRPLTGITGGCKNIEDSTIRRLKMDISLGIAECPALPTVPGLLGMMPDWNPTELLGSHPKPLALSLYRALISSYIWCETRAELGYKNIGRVDFLRILAGRPYVDVRASLSSFLPNDLGADIEIPLLRAWLDRLCEYPSFHDSVEFNVAQTCFSFTFAQDYEDRYGEALNKKGKSRYFSALHSVSLKVICLPLNSLLDRQRKAFNSLQTRVTENAASIHSLESLIRNAISDGSRPFAFIARQAFVAESLLRSLQTRGALSVERVSQLRSSLPTITHRFSIDQRRFLTGDLSAGLFYARYGHLRPNSFDISSPCYRNRQWSKELEKSPDDIRQLQPFSLSGQESRAISQLLAEHQYDDLNPEALIQFITRAICGREESKFIFSAFLSDLLEASAEWGALHGLSREDLSYLSLEDIKSAMNGRSVAEQSQSLSIIIQRARRRYDKEKNLLLNPIISTIKDADYFWHIDNTPHFIGHSLVEACTSCVDHTTGSKEILHGRIVLIECADPGFDWIFTQKISGLITAYGGPNSHMAVRSAEFGIPAALGCGEMLFQRLALMPYIGLDCINKRVYVPDSTMLRHTERNDRCG